MASDWPYTLFARKTQDCLLVDNTTDDNLKQMRMYLCPMSSEASR